MRLAISIARIAATLSSDYRSKWQIQLMQKLTISRDRLGMLSTTATFSPYSSHSFLQLIQGILGSMKTMRFIDILNDWNNRSTGKKKHQDFFSPKSAHVSTGLPSPCPVGPGAMVMVVICVMVKTGKQRMMALQSLNS